MSSSSSEDEYVGEADHEAEAEENQAENEDDQVEEGEDDQLEEVEDDQLDQAEEGEDDEAEEGEANQAQVNVVEHENEAAIDPPPNPPPNRNNRYDTPDDVRAYNRDQFSASRNFADQLSAYDGNSPLIDVLDEYFKLPGRKRQKYAAAIIAAGLDRDRDITVSEFLLSDRVGALHDEIMKYL